MPREGEDREKWSEQELQCFVPGTHFSQLSKHLTETCYVPDTVPPIGVPKLQEPHTCLEERVGGVYPRRLPQELAQDLRTGGRMGANRYERREPGGGARKSSCAGAGRLPALPLAASLCVISPLRASFSSSIRWEQQQIYLAGL